MDFRQTLPKAATECPTASVSLFNRARAFIYKFRGKPVTDLVPRNLLTLISALIWMILIIICLPYRAPQVPQVPTYPESPVYISPLSEWPLNVVEKGLKFSSDIADILSLCQIKDSVEALGDDKGLTLVGDLLTELGRMSEHQSFRQDFTQLFQTHRQISSTLAHKLHNYSQALSNLTTHALNYSLTAEAQLQGLHTDLTTRTYFGHLFQTAKSTNQELRRIFQRPATELPFHLEELIRQSKSLDRDLVALDKIMMALTNPSEKEILEQRAKSDLYSASYWNTCLHPYRKQLSQEFRISNTKKQAQILATYSSRLSRTKQVISESNVLIAQLSIKQHILNRWLTQKRSLNADGDVHHFIQGYVELLGEDRGRLEVVIASLAVKDGEIIADKNEWNRKQAERSWYAGLRRSLVGIDRGKYRSIVD